MDLTGICDIMSARNFLLFSIFILGYFLLCFVLHISLGTVFSWLAMYSRIAKDIESLLCSSPHSHYDLLVELYVLASIFQISFRLFHTRSYRISHRKLLI